MNKESTYRLIKLLNDFSDRNKKSPLFDEVYFECTFKEINNFIKLFPIEFKMFEVVRSRSTPYATDLENIKQMGYPPIKFAKLSRCNHDEQPIFYGASNLETSFLEAGFTEEKPCAISAKFRLKAGSKLTLLPIGELDHYRRHKRARLSTPGISEQINEFTDMLNPYEYIAYFFVDAYIADFFSKPNYNKTQRNTYEVTARIANTFMSVDGIDGIIYPSVRHQGGLNYAISTDAFDSKFEIAQFSLTTPVRDLGYGLFEYYEHAHGTLLNDRGDFIWHGDPHFNARATIPLSAET